MPYATPLDELELELTDEGLDLAADSVGWFAADGSCLAVGWVHLSPEPSTQARWATVTATVHPDHRRRGIGTALVDRLVARGTAQLATAPPDPPRLLRASCFDHQADARRFLLARGFTPTRWFDQLTRDLRSDLPPATQPEGVVVTGWDDAHTAAALAVRNAAFADHWGSAPLSAGHWAAQTVDNAHFRRDLSVLAVRDGRVVGFISTCVYREDWEVLGREEAFVQTIGVVREARGRGVASAMLTDVLHRIAAAGLTHASLGVDADSPTRAHHLYRRLGFAPTGQWITHTRPLEGPPARGAG